MMDSRQCQSVADGLAGGLADLGLSKLTEKTVGAVTGDRDLGRVAGGAVTLASLSLPSGAVASAAVNGAMAVGTAGVSLATAAVATTATVVTTVVAPVAIFGGAAYLGLRGFFKLCEIIFDD